MPRILDCPQWIRWTITGAFFGFLNWLMLAPAKTFHNAHLGIFLTLALLVHWSLPPAYRAGWRRVAAVGGLAAYAGSIELLQPLLTKTGRQFERLDLVCNLVGVAAGWTLFAGLAGRLQAEESAVRTGIISRVL